MQQVGSALDRAGFSPCTCVTQSAQFVATLRPFHPQSAILTDLHFENYASAAEIMLHYSDMKTMIPRVAAAGCL